MDNKNLQKIGQHNRRVLILKNGPYLVSGGLPLSKEIIEVDGDGEPIAWSQGERYQDRETYALCRCGQSKSKPYCDETHAITRFDGTETASREKYQEQAKTISGPDLILTDAKPLCATARFCHRAGGTWELTGKSDDPGSREIAIGQACNCPSGRLVALDKTTAKPFEPYFKPSISLVEDPVAKASGPIWIKGGVLLESADGTQYETRNRVTLCRCGQSRNKPFCDGSHIAAGFRDGLCAALSQSSGQ